MLNSILGIVAITENSFYLFNLGQEQVYFIFWNIKEKEQLRVT